MSAPEETSVAASSPMLDDENPSISVLGTVQSNAVDMSSASAPDSLQSLASNVSLNKATSSADPMSLPAVNFYGHRYGSSRALHAAVREKRLRTLPKRYQD